MYLHWVCAFRPVLVPFGFVSDSDCTLHACDDCILCICIVHFKFNYKGSGKIEKCGLLDASVVCVCLCIADQYTHFQRNPCTGCHAAAAAHTISAVALFFLSSFSLFLSFSPPSQYSVLLFKYF